MKYMQHWNTGTIYNDYRIWSSVIWACFWWGVLTTGDPDLLGAVIALINNMGD